MAATGPGDHVFHIRIDAEVLHCQWLIRSLGLYRASITTLQIGARYL